MIWTIAGSDSSAGAGLQADLKTACSLGVPCGTVVTSVTAQNTRKFARAEAVSTDLVKSQIRTLREDHPARVIKLGMMHTRDIVRELARELEASETEIVCDPVLMSTSGAHLLDKEAISELREKIFPLVDVLTPNRPEAEALVGFPILSSADVERAARTLISTYGFTAVIIKGGHGLENEAQDFFLSATETFWLSSPRQPGPGARGTGCTFATALACWRALGHEWSDAAVLAKAYLNQALHQAEGRALLVHRPWVPDARFFPTASPDPRRNPLPRFPSCGPRALGFYPIVDRAHWLERLLPLGLTTAQLRIKDLQGAELEGELARAIALTRAADCRLFINDHWRLAIELGAYGVHLGQEDLAAADLPAIHAAGLRLGLSTHSPLELARALHARPSYIALGPIYPTTLKAMRFAPQGETRLKQWCALAGDIPVVAIGGLSLERAPRIAETGARSIAVVSDITQNPDPEARARAWLCWSEETFA